MRKILTVIVTLLMISPVMSQQWVDVGIKGSYGSTWLLNGNIFKDTRYVHDFSFGSGYGFKVGYNFSEEIELTVDMMFASANQKFNVKTETNGWAQNIRTKTMDIPLLFRKNADGTYFEIGPQYSMVKSVSEDVDGTARNLSPYFQKSYFAGVLGFGSYFIGTDNTALTVGLRISYGFMDLVNESRGSADGYTFPFGSNDVDSPYYADPYESYKPTNPFAVVFLVELNHDLGYMARASCRKRSKLILFNL